MLCFHRTHVKYGEKVTLECKKAENGIPKSVWETYSAFANTNDGDILLGVEENLSAEKPQDRFTVCGVKNAEKLRKNFWNTLNSNKVSTCLLKDEDVQIVQYDENTQVIAIHVPLADYRNRPVYINDNILKGSFKRNFEGDYHCPESDVRAMIRDANDDGNDGTIIERYTIDDIDLPSLRAYRNEFENHNVGHAYNQLDDKEFLRQFGALTFNRATQQEELTMAGLLMFGKGLSIRERFSNFRMDYIDMTNLSGDMRYSDRITYDGTWENNLYNFFRKVLTKLTSDLKRPFRLDGVQRDDDTLAHKAIREALTNSIIHADFFLSSGVLRIEKHEGYFCFRNPGSLKLPVSRIYAGGSSKSRNPHIQNILRMIGFGENLGSGFPTILNACRKEQWRKPDLVDNSDLNEVSLKLWMVSVYPKEVDDFLHHFLGSNYDNLDNIAKSALSVAYVEKEVSNQRLQTLLELKPIEVAKLLRYLTDIELLVSEYKGRWTIYRLNKEVSNFPKVSNSKVSNSEKVSNPKVSNSASLSYQILELIKSNSKISRKTMATQLGVSVKTIQTHINKLKFNNKIRRIGPATFGGEWEIIESN